MCGRRAVTLQVMPPMMCSTASPDWLGSVGGNCSLAWAARSSSEVAVLCCSRRCRRSLSEVQGPDSESDAVVALSAGESN
eukprot:14968282-Alexandrium_andersonii.AAC.1